MRSAPLSFWVLLAGLAPGCATEPAGTDFAVPYAAKAERVADFAALLPPRRAAPGPPPKLRLDRVTAGVPWPRGLAWVDGKLVVLARGRHRRAGGVDPKVADRCGTLMVVDPRIHEPVRPGEIASAAVRANARVFATPTDPPLHLYDGTTRPDADTTMDRPYCTLIQDPRSRNLFLCGYSGVDLPGAKFRKNATDSILRYDMRTGRWHGVEQHDAAAVPPAELGYVVSNRYYPHHDPARHKPPHGWLNGPDGGCVAGRWLYCTGKDNHALVRYDLDRIRRDPAAPPPESRRVLGPRVRVRYPGGERMMEVLGPSAAAARDGWLYVGYRTSSVVLRFALDRQGDLVQPVAGELIAVFEPWDASKKRSANLIDLAFDSHGELFVSCAKEGRIWKVGVPDPQRPFNGNDHGNRPTTAPPWLDLRAFTGKKTGCGNILFDDEDRLYVCVGNYDAGNELAGAVYRAVEIE